NTRAITQNSNDFIDFMGLSFSVYILQTIILLNLETQRALC
ncbi:MAG: hypothetical protein QG663_1811, partial [Thermodesulfobacteriota bacterium]|nr:hypothetical protein [Thermodesulfobacteriota bacterium]